MTIATTRTAELSVAEIVTAAFERAGLKNEAEELDEVRQAKGRRELKLILDKLSTHGRVSRTVLQTEVTLVAGQREYQLDLGTIDVNGVATSSARILTPMTREEQMILENSTTAPDTGAPLRYYVDHTGAQVSLQFWQTPSTDFDGEVVLVQREVFRADVTTGAMTPDVERYWVDAIVWALAHVLAISGGLVNRASLLKNEAKDGLDMALSRARPRGVTQARLSAPSPWRN